MWTEISPYNWLAVGFPTKQRKDTDKTPASTSPLIFNWNADQFWDILGCQKLNVSSWLSRWWWLWVICRIREHMGGTCPLVQERGRGLNDVPHYFPDPFYHPGFSNPTCLSQTACTDVTAGTFQICESGTLCKSMLSHSQMWNLKLLTSSLTISVVLPLEIHLPAKAHLFSALIEAKDRAAEKARQGGWSAGLQYGAPTTTPATNHLS